jgi:hypothetical protein
MDASLTQRDIACFVEDWGTALPHEAIQTTCILAEQISSLYGGRMDNIMPFCG